MMSNAGSQEKMPTDEQGQGPFYPVIKPAVQGRDLTTLPGKTGTAKGQPLQVSGRLLDIKGKPIAGAQVEIWQANSFGKYTHPFDTNTSPLDPNFLGYGLLTTDSEGNYRFKTVKPAPYPVSKDRVRPPHIHFCVTSKTNRLITQMYFPGEPLNEKDALYRSAPNPQSLLPALTSLPVAGPDALSAVWDIVLRQW